MKVIRIMIADDHPIYSNGLAQLFTQIEGMEITAVAEDGKQLLEAVKNEPPDVVLTDIEMPVLNGIEVCKHLNEHYGDIKIVVLSIHKDEDMVLEALCAGAHAYLSKLTTIDELATRIHAVLRGEYYYPGNTSDYLKKMARKATEQANALQVLNDQEVTILQLVSQEKSTQEIAQKSNLSPKTIEKYRSRILEKTNSKTMMGAVMFAIRNGYMKI